VGEGINSESLLRFYLRTQVWITSIGDGIIPARRIVVRITNSLFHSIPRANVVGVILVPDIVLIPLDVIECSMTGVYVNGSFEEWHYLESGEVERTTIMRSFIASCPRKTGTQFPHI